MSDALHILRLDAENNGIFLVDGTQVAAPE